MKLFQPNSDMHVRYIRPSCFNQAILNISQLCRFSIWWINNTFVYKN